MSGVTLASVATAATIAAGAVSVGSALGVFGGKPKAPSMPVLPTPQVPAQAATTNRNDTGSQVVVGAEAVKNQRVSGSSTNGGTQAQSQSVTDILGGLGAGGINI